MNETAKIILTSCGTAMIGVVIFCATSLLNKLVIEPLSALRKTLGDVSFCLQYHSWVFHQGKESVKPERYQQVFDDLRSYTARLRADANSVVGYSLFAWLGIIPRHADLIEAAGNLIGLSNTLGMDRWDDTHERFNKAGELLRIDVGRPRFKRGKPGDKKS